MNQNRKMKKVRIYVTKEDIKLGCKGEASKCPVAKAIMRTLKVNYVCIYQHLAIEKEHSNFDLYYRVEMKTPEKAFAFINAFDSYDEEIQKTAKSFQFTIEVPEWLIQQ